MANKIRISCHFRSTDALEVEESQGKLMFQLEGLDEDLQVRCLTSVYSTPEDAIKFAERVIKLAIEIKGVEKNG